MKPEKIVEVGADGGSISLFGWQDDKSEWHFLRETDERTLMGMMPEEDRNSCTSESVVGWDEGLKLLNRYPWLFLYPLYVHPDFGKLVLQEVYTAREKNDGEFVDLTEWEMVCFGKSHFRYPRVSGND